MRLVVLLPFVSLLGLTACSSAEDDQSAAGSGASSAQGTGGAGGGSASAGTGGGVFSYEAPVTAEPAAGAEAIVIWSVSATSPDYVYHFGDASIGGGQKYIVSFSSDPPAEALNNDLIGIGYVLLLAPGTPLPPAGKIADWDTIESAMVGATTRHAVIFRKGAEPGIAWAAAFPQGYACGACVAAASGFESYEPVDCAELEIDLPADPSMLDFCNWT